MTTIENNPHDFDDINDHDANDDRDVPVVVVGQLFIHPERDSYTVVTGSKNGVVSFTSMGHDGVAIRGKAIAASMIETFGVPSLDEIVNMDKGTKEWLLEESGALILTQGWQNIV